MPKEYFKEVFKEEPEELAPKVSKKKFNDQALKKGIAFAEAEIQRLQDGTSEFKKGALYLGANKNPAVLATLKRFKNDPNLKTLKTFLEIAKQDLTLRPAQEIANRLIIALEEDSNE